MIKTIEKKEELPDLYKEKMQMLDEQKQKYKHDQKIAMPLVLNNYDMLPFWTKFFDCLQIEVVWTTPTTQKMYYDGQQSIPSDTACFPAKVVHGPVSYTHLLDQGRKRITPVFDQ